MRTIDSTCRRAGLCWSILSIHVSGNPSLRAAESGSGSISASSERSVFALRTVLTASTTSSAGMPRLTCTVSRALSVAKLDHSARTSPVGSVTTPSKSVGGFTSVATSMFASRNCSVRDSGNEIASSDATTVDCDRTRESGPRPTTVTGSPARNSRVSKRAARIGVPSSSCGSNDTIARLCSGWTYSTRPGTSTEPANVRRTSPTATGTVLRSTTTSPRCGVDDDAGAVVVALGDTGDRERHVERHEHERRRETVRLCVARRDEASCARASPAASPPGRAGPCTARCRCCRRDDSDAPETSAGRRERVASACLSDRRA